MSPTVPPNAPTKKTRTKTPKNLDGVRRKLELEFPPSLSYDTSEETYEAQYLASTGDVREKYLRHTPYTVSELDDVEYLEKLWELYFPATQPRNVYEESYLELMRRSIDRRLRQLDY